MILYGLPPSNLKKAPDDPGQMAAFLHAAGDPLGTLTFGPGESTLFLEAAEEATGASLMPLLESPIGDTAPDDVHLFGILEGNDLAAALDAMESFLAEATPQSSGVKDLCERCELDPNAFLSRLNELRGLALKAIDSHAALASAYREEH